MKKDVEESRRIEKLLKGRKKQCYYNAFRTIMEVPEYANADYVEGMAVLAPGLIIEHGWVEKDGAIIDPSMPYKPVTYFPGLRFHGQAGLAKAMNMPKPSHTEEDLPVFYRFGWGGIDSPEFRAAIVAANRHIGAEDVAARYENYEPVESEEVLVENGEVLSVS